MLIDEETGKQQTRNVNENSPPGTKVGEPVTAGDAGDILTYTLTGDGPADDKDSFTIDPATGQIMVGRKMLNAEAGSNDPIPNVDRDDTDGFQLRVTVRATDPFGDPNIDTVVIDNGDEVTVTITVKDVNEAPMNHWRAYHDEARRRTTMQPRVMMSSSPSTRQRTPNPVKRCLCVPNALGR